tara:strand:+ start:1197 stop:1523 length:327 start_codon:yes stop_codon:yes gene_type:complete
MKVLKLNTPLKISAVVRVAPVLGDILTMTAVNEFSGNSKEYTLIWDYLRDRLIFYLSNTNTDFVPENKYEITIKNGVNVIYLGKMIVVNQSTDTQNYTPSSQTTQRYK